MTTYTGPRRRAPRAVLATVIASMVAVLAGCSSGSVAESTSRPATSPQSGFPVTIEHEFGSTTIRSRPQRVVTVGFNEQDFALAFGVEPVGVREFLGYDAPKRPWAPESVRGRTIPTVGANELNFEKIAGLRPDLILGINAYIDKAAYQKLAAIAPTVAQSGDVAQGATTWSDQTLTTGKALGRSAEARQIVDRTRKAFSDARASNPSFAGKSAAFALGSSAGGSYSLGADDYRTGWLTELGFTVPQKGQDVSFEKFGDVFDTDVVLAEGMDAKTLANPLVRKLPAVTAGRFIDLGAFDQDFAAALGFNSPLSIPYLLKIAVPRLAAATDGDPKTVPEPYQG